MAQRVAAETRIQPREILELRWHSASACAFLQARVVAVSRRSLEILDDDELASVLAHEYGHLTGPPLLFRALLFLGFETPLAILNALFASLGSLGFLTATLSIVIALLGPRLVIRRWERKADEVASQAYPEAFPRALRLLYADNLLPQRIGGPFLSHPELVERVGATASAKSPSRMKVLGLLLAGCVSWFGALFVLDFLARNALVAGAGTEAGALVADDALSLLEAARRSLAGDRDASRIDLWIVVARAQQGQCDGAAEQIVQIRGAAMLTAEELERAVVRIRFACPSGGAVRR